MIIGNSVGVLWHISIYTVFIIPIVLILLIRKKRLSGRRLCLTVVLCAGLEILSFVPSVTMILEDDFISTAFICLFCYVTDFWTFGPFAMPILAVCVAAVSRLRSVKSKIAFAVLLVVCAALVILRLRYGGDWMQGIIDYTNSVYERIDPDGVHRLRRP